MTKEELLSEIKKVERLAQASKIQRMLAHPLRYVDAILFREIFYKNTRREKQVVSHTFFGVPMYLLLPSSTDIYLTGGKSHSSEVRLAKFLINHLKAGDTFIDVGAHYGYFSLLASTIVGNSGQVFAFEASPTTYSVLKKNSDQQKNINSKNLAVSDTDTPLTFFEFPNLYSEYNTLDVGQFKNEEWYINNKPVKLNIDSVVLSDFLLQNQITPNIIKIDVEGAEFKVMSGLKEYLSAHSATVIIEFLSDERGNDAHMKAKELLEALGLKPHVIDASGQLELVSSITDYINNLETDSDNVVFTKD